MTKMKAVFYACFLMTASVLVGYYVLSPEKSGFSFGNRAVVDKRNVYFLETSGRGTLDLRQLAVVESAAHFITDCSIRVLLFTEKDLAVTRAMEDVRKTYEVRFTRESMWNVTTGTPLQDWFRKGDWKSSPYKVSHLSDAHRFLVLWLHGGLYLDLDVLLIRPWTIPNNTLTIEGNEFASSVLAFRRGHPFLSDCLDEFANHYRPFQWASNGPLLIKRVSKVSAHYANADIKILPQSAFSEIYYPEQSKFFEAAYVQEVLNRTSRSYGVHLWNKLSADRKVSPSSDCAYMRMVRKSSPVVYEHMKTAQYV